MSLDQAIRLVSRRLRLGRAMTSTEHGFLVGLVLTLVYALVARLWPSYDVGLGVGLLFLPCATAAIGFVGGLVTGGVARLPAARELDRRLGLAERTSTATWLAAQPTTNETFATGVQEDAEAHLAAIDAESIARAFRVPLPRRLLIYIPLLLIGFLATPFVPSLGASTPAIDGAQRAKEAQQVREAARKLEKRAEEVARLAELKKLEEARKMARKLETAAQKIALSPPSKKEALSELSKLSDQLHKDMAKSLDAEKGAAFGLDKESLGALSELARELDQLDPTGLSLDLEEWRESLLEETEQAIAEGREPRVDQQQLRDLMDRLSDTEELMRRMQEQFEALQSEEYARLSQEQVETLRRIQEMLKDLNQRCPGGQCEGRPMSAEELEELLRKLESLSTEELQQLIEMMNQMRAGQSLSDLVSQCKSEIGGGVGQMSDGELGQLIQQLSQMRMGDGGGMGPNAGRGSGGEAQRGPDDGLGAEPSRVKGRLDPKGNLGQRVPFQGIPKEKDAKLEFDAAVGRAAAAAEESLGRDLLPADAKPFVRRYFEALQKDGDGSGK